jgi:hypothetical protein
MNTLAEQLAATLRTAAQAYAAGDQVAPCAVLWTDPERLWECVMPELQPMLPELFLLGTYAPEKRTGPALWLRCIEARVVEGAPVGTTPIFYLPGISKEKLRAAEDCPQELAALVELQYRGMVWLHVNGKEWTPYAFLVSNHGGLGLDVAKDQGTLDALAGALPSLMSEPLSHLQLRRLDAEFFNGLVAPDATGLLLRWLGDPVAFKERLSDAEWKAFCEQCKADFRFDPVKEGPLKAAQFLADRGNHWSKVWQRFAEAPVNYPGVVEWLKRAAPKVRTSMFDTAEVWPTINESEERKLKQSLESLVDRPQDEAILGVSELEAQHAGRRSYPWQKLGLSPLATALEPLARLAKLCQAAPGAPTPEAYAEFYASNGWRVDAAALATMAACGTAEQHGAVLGTVRAVYLPWLEKTARHLQQLIRENGQSVSKRAKPIATAAGRLVMFADGLRMDVAQQLAEKLAAIGIESTHDWEWSTIPSVTATAKPAASPIADIVQGGEAGDEFSTRLISTGQLLSQDRFMTALKACGWQILGSDQNGDPSGSAWTEASALDKRGHNEGWKLARSVETEVRDLVSRIGALIKAGWKEVVVVTDHGWLLLPGGLPKVELKSFLAEHRWGRCAALKSDAQTNALAFKWHWNPTVTIASPPGAGCFRAAMEYSHGGVSLQEMVTPVLRLIAARPTGGSVRILEAKWTGAKFRVSIGGDCAGVRVDVRTSQSDPNTSLLADKQARETTPDGKVSVFLENDSDLGKVAAIVLLDASGQAIDSLTTKLGE